MAVQSNRWSKNWKPAPPANETDGLVIHGPLIGPTVKFREAFRQALRLRFPRLRSGQAGQAHGHAQNHTTHLFYVHAKDDGGFEPLVALRMSWRPARRRR